MKKLNLMMALVASCTLASAGIAAESSSPASTAKKSNQVVLGDPELTAGIPGDGTLKLEEIQKWLADPANHQPLEVELPYGLAAASGQITGLEETPMTRAKIELGRQLYFDPRLSSDQTISCASCHHPDKGWAFDSQFGVGVDGQQGNRNSPVAYNRILSAAQFWDGRAATLEEQAIGPIANPIEMGNTHDFCVECLQGIPGYQVQFQKIFGGDITIESVGKALATFERAIVTGPTPYDYYEVVRNFQQQFPEDELKYLQEDEPELYEKYAAALKGSEGMSESAKRGREIFFTEKGNCTACHAGANFTDELYHNIGVGMDAEEPDLGRYEVTKEDKDRGAFKTPTIRNIVQTAPYMHDGSQKTLEEVVDWYDQGGHPNPYLSDKMKKLNLTAQEKKDLVEFMKSVTGEFPKIESNRLPE